MKGELQIALSNRPKLPRPPEFYIREYCKLWLRAKAPSLATDDMEAEINIVMGLVLPIALASLTAFVVVDKVYGILLACLCFVFALFLDRWRPNKRLSTSSSPTGKKSIETPFGAVRRKQEPRPSLRRSMARSRFRAPKQ
jgi:hypothetical protein